MIQRLMEFIGEYHERVREAASLFKEHMDIATPMDWRQAGLSRTGFIDSAKTMEYAFHGSGCRVALPSGPVDWNFGYDGRLDGLHPWFLWEFAEDGTDNFPEFKNKKNLDEVFQAAVSQGLIDRPFEELQDSLFYLRKGNSAA